MRRFRNFSSPAAKPRMLKLESLERREVFAAGLDPSFVYGWGATATDFGNTADFANDSAFQSDGKIVLVGGTSAGGGQFNFALARYLPNGALDPSFGGMGGIGNGRVATDFALGVDVAEKVLILPDGKILVLGSTVVETDDVYGSERRWAFAKYNSDGTLDPSFGVLGRVVVDLPNTHEHSHVTNAFLIGDQFMVIDRYEMAKFHLSDGSLDLSFGLQGRKEILLAGAIDAAAVHGDGFVVGGSISNASFFVARLTANGDLDLSFGNGGSVSFNLPGGVNALISQADGAIVGAGFGHLFRLLPNGTLDGNFNVDGRVELPNGTWINELALSAGGVITGVGSVFTFHAGDDTDYRFLVVRIGSDGAPDLSFGPDGMFVMNIGGDISYARSVLTYANGNILVAGTANHDETVDHASDFALTRLKTNYRTTFVHRPGGLATLELPIDPLGHAFGLSWYFRSERSVAGIQRLVSRLLPNATVSISWLPSRSSAPVARRTSGMTNDANAAKDLYFASLAENEAEVVRGQLPYQVSLRSKPGKS